MAATSHNENTTTTGTNTATSRRQRRYTPEECATSDWSRVADPRAGIGGSCLACPGGHVIFTTHGERYLSELTESDRSSFAAGRLVIRRDDRPGSNVCGAYHPEAYVRDHLAQGFTVVDFVAEGAAGNPHQDLWLLRRN